MLLITFQTVDKGQKDKPTKQDPSPLDPITTPGDTFDGLDPLSMFMAEQAASKSVPTSGPKRERVNSLQNLSTNTIVENHQRFMSFCISCIPTTSHTKMEQNFESGACSLIST